MSNKVLSLVATFMIASNVLAEVDCKPFRAEAKIKEEIVQNFTYEIEKIQKKVFALEEKIGERMVMISQIDQQMQGYQSQITQIQEAQASLRDSMSGTQSMIQSKAREAEAQARIISQTQYQIDHLPGASNARREALRENMRAKKIFEKIQEEITSLDMSLAPLKAQIAQLNQEWVVTQDRLTKLDNDRIEVENMLPTLSSLRNKKEQAEAELFGQDQVQAENMRLADEAREKVLMCVTYNVKYPLVKDIAREVYSVGCENYRLKDFKQPAKDDAQMEILEAMCK